MMDHNIFQLVFGTASTQKIGQDLRSPKPFAKFDALSPEEPGWVWQVGKRLLNIPRQVLTARLFQKPSNVAQRGIQITIQ